MILGFNSASDPRREEALIRARDTGHFAMTEPLQLLQDEKISPGVVVFYPVYKRLNSVSTILARRDSLAGYAAAIVRTNDLIDEALVPLSSGDYHLNITDITAPENPKAFYHTGDLDTPAYAHDLVLQQEIVVGGRNLLISVSPTEKYLTSHVSLQSWFVLAGGLLFCSLLGGFLLLVSGRTQHISNLVERRTKELAAILENAVESILVVNEQGRIQEANPAAAQLFKYPLMQFAHLHICTLRI